MFALVAIVVGVNMQRPSIVAQWLAHVSLISANGIQVPEYCFVYKSAVRTCEKSVSSFTPSNSYVFFVGTSVYPCSNTE